jgi:hypothetical protein
MYASSSQYVFVPISINGVLPYICSNKPWHILVASWPAFGSILQSRALIQCVHELFCYFWAGEFTPKRAPTFSETPCICVLFLLDSTISCFPGMFCYGWRL